MLREGGRVIATNLDGGIDEISTITCAHCCRVVQVKARLDDVGGFCRLCMKPVCAACVATGTCDPFEKKLERAEAAYHARRSYGL
jgi:hypothetical protein